jgi:ABC-2 type transport system permease protein
MQSSLSMVYDREMGMMRLLLTAPLPRWYLLLVKLASGAVLGVTQAYAFLLVCWPLGITLPAESWLYLLPTMIASALMLGAFGLLLSLTIRQVENFAGMMNFAIFPMFFLSSALYPLWTLRETATPFLWWIASANPFTFAVELMRFAAYGRFNAVAAIAVIGFAITFFALAVVGYDPQRGLSRRRAAP